MTGTSTDRPLRRRRGDLAPRPELWAVLEQGARLRRILEDFYALVYADPVLAPFFEGVPRERIVGQQYGFLAEIFTGEKIYCGDRPRNAHHWMVISDELFDHREALMEGCLRRHGLPEPLIRDWMALEEIFRKQIVKERPIPKRVRGVDLPLDGYETLRMAAGAVCDACHGEIPVGAEAVSHVRTGRTCCTACAVRPSRGASP